MPLDRAKILTAEKLGLKLSTVDRAYRLHLQKERDLQKKYGEYAGGK